VLIEYKSGKFGGALQNKLLVTEFSGGDDILALTLALMATLTVVLPSFLEPHRSAGFD
jgi:hypothetical protein